MSDAEGDRFAKAVVISFSGADGSGKTTLADRVAVRLRELGPSDLEVQRLWLRWNPRARLAMNASDLESTLDVRHKGNMSKRVLTRLHAGSAWATAAERLYDYQLRLQIGAVPDTHIIIADRYVPDFYADLVASAALPLNEVGRRAKLFHPTAARYLVDVPDRLLLSRRSPTEDPARLTSRAELYRRLAPELRLEVIDPMETGCESRVARQLLSVVSS